jgi:aspartyl-tRNA(Asn)/glutamyl-tRNA(Gln) amidotransferase subunit C
MLSRLKLRDDEVVRFTEQLSAIINYVDQLSELDTGDVSPMAHALPVVNVFREDEVVASPGVETALANAPQREKSFFRVPKVLDQESA